MCKHYIKYTWQDDEYYKANGYCPVLAELGEDPDSCDGYRGCLPEECPDYAEE